MTDTPINFLLNAAQQAPTTFNPSWGRIGDGLSDVAKALTTGEAQQPVPTAAEFYRQAVGPSAAEVYRQAMGPSAAEFYQQLTGRAATPRSATPDGQPLESLDDYHAMANGATYLDPYGTMRRKNSISGATMDHPSPWSLDEAVAGGRPNMNADTNPLAT